MEQLSEYIKPELLVVAAVLFVLRKALQKTALIKEKYIPLWVGGAGIIICSVYVFAVCDCRSGGNIAMAFFTSITQGILVAGLSAYAGQLGKKLHKKD